MKVKANTNLTTQNPKTEKIGNRQTTKTSDTKTKMQIIEKQDNFIASANKLIH